VIKGHLVTIAYNATVAQYGGSTAGTMVMWAIANRVRKAGMDWSSAINTISDYMQNGEGIPNIMPNIWDASFLALSQIVDDVYDGRGKDLSCGGLYWADTAKPISDDFMNDIVRNPGLSRTAQMNSLQFWGEKEKVW
jgi:hypothetical protein